MHQGNFPWLLSQKTTDMGGQVVQTGTWRGHGITLVVILWIEARTTQYNFEVCPALNVGENQVILSNPSQSKLGSIMVHDRKLPLSIGIKQKHKDGYLGREH